MTSSILNFFEARSRTQVETPRGWTNQELAEFYRVADSLNQAGLAVETDLGVSDEGEPWFAFYHPDTADVVAHFARINGRFVAAGASLDEVVDGRDLREIIDRMLRTKPMLMPIGKGRGAGNLLLHPAIVLTAFVATALFTMQDAEASPLGKSGDSHDNGAAPAEKHAKAAPVLIQKLLASAESAGSSKQNTSEALNQGFQQIALQSAIAFAVAQLPIGTQAILAGDLFDTSMTTIAAVKTAEISAAAAIESLADISHSSSLTSLLAAAATAENTAASGSHTVEDRAVTTIAFSTQATTQISPLVEAALAQRDDAAAVLNTLHATPALMAFLHDVAQAAPQQAHAAPASAPASDSSAAVKVTADPTPKTLEVTLAIDSTHTAFLQSQLFKELFHVQTVDITQTDTTVAADGTIKVKVVFQQPAEKPATLVETTAPVAVPDHTDAVVAVAAVAAVAPPAETVVKTGIDIFDHIIDYSVSYAAAKSDPFAQALLAIDSANGHLLAGAKRIVLFDSHDLSVDVYRISDDVVMIDVDLLHLTHDQAAAGHATATMSLPNGGTVELVGVLAPPPGLI